MSHLPRHLLLAAVFFTVCCADGQVPATQDASQRQAIELAGRSVVVSAIARRESVGKQHVRPAASTYALARAAIIRGRAAERVSLSPTFRGPALTFDQMRLPPPTA